MIRSKRGEDEQDSLDAGRILALGRDHREGAHIDPHPECSRCRIESLGSATDGIGAPEHVV